MSRIEKSLKNLFEKMFGEKANGDCICSIIDDAANRCGNMGSTQPDLAQNFAAAPDYVKNRTHYAEQMDINSVVTLQASADEQILTIPDVRCNFAEEAQAKAYVTFLDPSNKETIMAIKAHYLANGKKQFAASSYGVEVWTKAEPTETDGLYNIIFYIINSNANQEITYGYVIDYVKKIDAMYLPEVTYYYVNNQYLCHDENGRKKVTADECKAAMKGVVRILWNGTPENGSCANVAEFNTSNEWVELTTYSGTPCYTSEYVAGGGPS